MTEDIKRQQQGININNNQSNNEHIFNRYLALLQSLTLNMAGKMLKDYGLPEPSSNLADNDINSDFSMLHEFYDINELTKKVTTNEKLLNREQELVYTNVLKIVNEESGDIFFLDAPGGTGKTFLINLLLLKVRTKKHIAIAEQHILHSSSLLT